MSLSCNGTSQGAQSASSLAALSGRSLITVAFWYKGTLANDDDMLIEYTANGITTDGGFGVLGNDSGVSKVAAFVRGTASNSNSITGTNPSSSAWHHFTLLYDISLTVANDQAKIYVDGTATPTTNFGGSTSTGTFVSSVLNVMCRNGASLFADGEIADLAIWGGATVLSGSEVTSLQTARANTVRTSDLLYYWPLTSSATATTGSINLTLVGSPSFTADPPALPGIQTLTPATDITTTGWTATGGTGTFASTMDETVADDTDYATSPSNPTSSVLEVKLTGGIDPASSTGHQVQYRIASVSAATSSVLVSLYQGTTLIASETRTSVPSAPTDYSMTLTGTQADSITDYTDLRIRFTATAT